MKILIDKSMAMRIKLIFSILLVVLSTLSNAAVKNDFAYGFSLEVDGDGAIYSLHLNEAIYQGLTREDRADLRIFNGNGQVVPHDIRRAEKMTRQKLPAVELPIFPLYKEGQAEMVTGAGYNVHITTNEQGAIIDLNYGKATSQERILAGYIIDASSLEHAPELMTINWNEKYSDFVRTVRVEGSDDLSSWRTLVSRSVLSDLQHGKHTLIQKSVELPHSLPKYLRLSWARHEPFEVNSIQFEFPETYRGQERNWSDFVPVHFDEKQNAYYFNTKSVLPVDRLNVKLPQRNTLVNVLVESAAAKDGPWYTRFRGLLYELQYGQNNLKNPDIHQPVHSHRYWRLTILNGEGELSGEPILNLGWIAEELLFVATGESPFTLAYGSARVGPVAAPLAQLLSKRSIKQQGRLIKPAKLGAEIDLGDESRLEPPKPPLDWKRYLLWAVLIVGVAALALMAMRLYKQMEEKDAEE